MLSVRVFPNNKDFVCDNATVTEEESLVTSEDYSEGYKIYLVELARAQGDNASSSSYMPTLPFQASDKTDYEIGFDGTLYASLLQVYLFEGWAGVAAIAKLVEAKAPSSSDKPSAGVNSAELRIWQAAKRFFYYGRFLLAKLVFQNLKTIERKSGTVIYTHLNGFVVASKKIWETDFGFYVRPEGGLRDFRCRTKTKSNTLFSWTSEYVTLRDMSQRLADKIGHLKTLESDLASELLVLSAKQAVTPDFQIPDRIALTKKALADAIATEHNTKQQLDVVEKAFAGTRLDLMERIHETSPVGLMVLSQLKMGFLQSEMENKIGSVLKDLMDQQADLLKKINPSTSLVAAEFPYLDGKTQKPSDVTKNWLAAQNTKLPEEGLEAYLVNKALSILGEQPAWYPLTSSEILNGLIRDEVIQRDSIEAVVQHWYSEYLMTAVEKARASEAKWKLCGGVIMRSSAAFNLAALIIGTLAPEAVLAVVTREVAAQLGFVLLANFLVTTPKELASLSTDVSKTIIQYEGQDMEMAASIGRALQGREDFIQTTGIDVVLMLLNSLPLAEATQLLHAYNYYQDMETLVND